MTVFDDLFAYVESVDEVLASGRVSETEGRWRIAYFLYSEVAERSGVLQDRVSLILATENVPQNLAIPYGASKVETLLDEVTSLRTEARDLHDAGNYPGSYSLRYKSWVMAQYASALARVLSLKKRTI